MFTMCYFFVLCASVSRYCFLCLCYECFKHATQASAHSLLAFDVWYFCSARLFYSAHSQIHMQKKYFNPHLFSSIPRSPSALVLPPFFLFAHKFEYSHTHTRFEFIVHQHDFVANMSQFVDFITGWQFATMNPINTL